MKNLFIFSVLILVITSCSKYHINVLSSTNMKKDPGTGNFITEDDSVKITYSFFGRNAPIYLDVYNKLNEPMYIDWQRSDFITNNNAVSYADDKVHITGDISGTSIGNKTLNFTDGSIDATARIPKTTVFIPPHTHVTNTLLEVIDQQFDNIPVNGFIKKEITSQSISGTSIIKIGEFAPEQSPLNFKSYLTLYTLNNNVQNFKAYQHDFYLSQIIKTAEQPENFDFYAAQRADYFFTSKTTDFGKAATGVGLAAVLVGVAALDSKSKVAK